MEGMVWYDVVLLTCTAVLQEELMIAIVKSTALNGLEGQVVEVEVDVSNGLPSFEIVGTYSRHYKESRPPRKESGSLYNILQRYVMI